MQHKTKLMSIDEHELFNPQNAKSNQGVEELGRLLNLLTKKASIRSIQKRNQGAVL